MTLRQLIYAVPAILAVVVFGIIFFYSDNSFPKFYEDKMRASLFTGLFTLSGFLLSAKTFIILNLKKEMFSTKMYLKRVKAQMALAEGNNIRVYRPLKDIGEVLIINVALCLTSSVLQFTLGLFATTLTVAICLAFASAAAGMLAFSLVVIARNLHDMYDHFEEEAQSEISKMETTAPRANES